MANNKALPLFQSEKVVCGKKIIKIEFLKKNLPFSEKTE